jgi:hypothetical protein
MPLSDWALAAPLAAILFAICFSAALTVIRDRTGKLDRAGRLGVRSQASLASDAAFTLANRVSRPLVAGAAAATGICGLVVVLVPTLLEASRWHAPALVVFAVGLVGGIALLVAAGRLGDRAARTVPLPARRPGGAACSGCACGGGGCSVLQRTTSSEA